MPLSQVSYAVRPRGGGGLGDGGEEMSIRRMLRTVMIHLAIMSAGFVAITTVCHERFDVSQYLYLAGVSVARDVWQAGRQRRARRAYPGITYDEPQEGVWPPPPRRPQ